MNILIVEDQPSKAKKIKAVVDEALLNQEFHVFISGSNAECLKQMSSMQTISLLVLDLNLPVRPGEFAKKDSGLKLLKEIIRRPELVKPDCIIGLTQYKNIQDSARSAFDQEGWVIIKYDPKDNDWEEAIRNKIHWLLTKINVNNSTKELTKILFIASSPHDQSPLKAGMEQRLIEEALMLSTLRNDVVISFKQAAKLETLTRELMQMNPHVLHFTGHGSVDGIAMEKADGTMELIPNAALERLFRLFKDKLKCVVLSSCYSSEQAKTISLQNIYVIGMNDSVGVDAATEFSKGFYQAVGEGKNITDSFNFGLVHLTSSDELQQCIPELWLSGNKL
jgi:CheY-like chemotaxis protein